MLLVTAAAAAPPELTRVAASGEAAPGAQGAVFVRHTAAGFDADGVLVWRATLEDDEGERDAFLRSTTAGTDALHDGEPAPDGGVFGLSGLSPTPDADGSVFVAQPADHVALYAHRDDGVEVLVAEGDPLDSGPVEQFVIAAAHGGDVLLRETAPGGQVSLLWARRGAQLTRAVVFDQPLDAIPGWNGDGLNRSGWLADGGIATFGVAEATTGRRAFATGPAGAPRLVDPQPWLPEGATCCVLLGVSGGGQAVYRGETVDGADTTVHLFAGPVDAPVEVLALPPGGIPIGNGQLGALAGPPVLGAREGFAFVGDQAVMFVYTPSAGLVRAVAPGEDGWAGVAPTPLAVSAAGHVAFEDTVDGHLGVYEWSPAGIEPWLVGGDVVEHPLEGGPHRGDRPLRGGRPRAGTLAASRSPRTTTTASGCCCRRWRTRRAGVAEATTTTTTPARTATAAKRAGVGATTPRPPGRRGWCCWCSCAAVSAVPARTRPRRGHPTPRSGRGGCPSSPPPAARG